MASFSERLREERLKRRLEPAHVDSACGFKRGATERLEAGAETPDVDIVDCLAEFFKVDFEYLAGETHIPQITGKVTTEPGLAGTVVRGTWSTRPGKVSEAKKKGQE